MSDKSGYYEKGDLVEVAITDDNWVEATVISDQETRVSVKLLIPVIWVEKTTIIKKSFFGLRTKTNTSEMSKFVETMTFSIRLVRNKTA